MKAWSSSLWISLYLVSSICYTKNISRFLSINLYLFSLFFGLSIGIVNPAASPTLILFCTLGLIANADGSMSVSPIFLKHPSLVGRFFSQIFNCLFRSLSSIFLSFSSSLNEKIFSSGGILNGLSTSSSPPY